MSPYPDTRHPREASELKRALLPGTIWPVHFDLMIYPARFLVAVALLFTASSFARDYRLSLAAPTADFAGQVISFRLPADAAMPAALRDA